jgi:hypothetical protein
MTAERLDRLSADDRERLGELCHRWAEMAEAPWGRDNFGRPFIGPPPRPAWEARVAAATGGGPDDGEAEVDADPSDPKDARMAREAKAIVGMLDLTFDDVKAMSPHGHRCCTASASASSR